MHCGIPRPASFLCDFEYQNEPSTATLCSTLQHTPHVHNSTPEPTSFARGFRDLFLVPDEMSGMGFGVMSHNTVVMCMLVRLCSWFVFDDDVLQFMFSFSFSVRVCCIIYTYIHVYIYEFVQTYIYV